jgi:hypothetical protein
MRTLHIKAYLLALVLSGIFLLASCTVINFEKNIRQIVQSEGLTLEEKVQELVSRGASRTEVFATLGPSTGYTHDTISYTVSNGYNPPKKLSYPMNSMNYPDPGHHGDYRWVLSFDDRGSLYKYRRIPIEYTEGKRVYRYLKDEIGSEWTTWHPAYRAGFTALECTNTEHCWAVGGGGTCAGNH